MTGARLPARGTLAALGFAGLAACVGCRGSKPPDDAPPVPTVASTAPAASAPPVDHLAPGELVEGSRRAFGIALPREVQVTQSFVDVEYAKGPVTVHSLAQYFAARLEGGSLREGPEAATFEHVKARGKPDTELRVRIALELGGSRLEIHDATPPPEPQLPDEAARWRKVGLTPQGKVLDPMHLD